MNNRIQSLDILRGLTILGMVLVNNPGGPDENTFSPLLHADWIGLTPADLVFPFFMFIMGMTTWLSLRHTDFKWSRPTAMKVMRRAFGLWLVGLSITCLFMCVRGNFSFDSLRILGVMPRLGICYGLVACLALSVNHRRLPWLIGVILAGYGVILATCNGYAHDATNILAKVDELVLGSGHVYRWDTPDPEGLLSTLPAVAHVLTGFCTARYVFGVKDLNQRVIRLLVIGTILAFVGALCAFVCPVSKKIWSPSFALVTCGLASLLLALATWVVDVCGRMKKTAAFFTVVGVNPLAVFVISDLLLIPFSLLPICGDVSLQEWSYGHLLGLGMCPKVASLTWALAYVAVNWLIALGMKAKGIVVKL